MEKSDKVKPTLFKYPSIESTIFPGKMLVMEKIDGSNIGIGHVNNSFQIQSRNKVLEEPYKEFNLFNIVEKLKEFVEKIRDIMKCDFIIYGELFGHLKNIKYYDPESEKVFNNNESFFRAFDIRDLNKNVFLKYTEAIKIFEKVMLPYLPILNIQYENIGDLYDRVEKEKSAYSDDIVEGFVLKADEEATCGSTRRIFKIKREKFNVGPVLNKYKVSNYVTDARFDSIFSKIGDNKTEILQEMVQDILNDITSVLIIDITNKVENFMDKKYEKYISKLNKKK